MWSPIPEWRDLVTTALTDLPTRVQEAIDRMSWNAVGQYASEEDRDDAWSGFAYPGLGGVAQVVDTPSILYVRNPETHNWMAFEPREERAFGLVTYTWAGGATQSAVVTVSFGGAFTAEPGPITYARESNVGSSIWYDAFTVAGSKTASQFQTVCNRNTAAPGGGATATLEWRAERPLA